MAKKQTQWMGPDCVVERKWKVELEAFQRWGSQTELREAVIGRESICCLLLRTGVAL